VFGVGLMSATVIFWKGQVSRGNVIHLTWVTTHPVCWTTCCLSAFVALVGARIIYVRNISLLFATLICRLCHEKSTRGKRT